MDQLKAFVIENKARQACKVKKSLHNLNGHTARDRAMTPMHESPYPQILTLTYICEGILTQTT